ncbi:hypothetical protein [Emticicia sp. 21SJ11W-3]|uniref:hypothetical protein n=1 Tax=Emticicia sp. 21SJ11W-3 TaxID=2916755 RepID=UPI00209F923E|nr:hypothetical protein [Emticicia sp. 21SJ11W-3]UTA66943.1 hypothetical protein MB380_15175 [Emticicia sp. 21SJ11W-3]
MAENTANAIKDYLLEIPAAHKETLGSIRHWDNLRAAFEGDTLWLKDINSEQADSVLIKGLPYSKVYYLKNGLLFLKDSLLPVKKLPQGNLWSPLAYTLPLTLPSFNHNYFGIRQKIAIRIVAADKEQPVFALLADKKNAGEYIQTAPKVRLNKLKWVGIDDNLLIAGTPLLPLPGRTYWLNNDFLLPSGFEFELPLLAKKLKQQIDPMNNMVILWQDDNTYIPIEKVAFVQLSISSFRLTYPQGN